MLDIKAGSIVVDDSPLHFQYIRSIWVLNAVFASWSMYVSTSIIMWFCRFARWLAIRACIEAPSASVAIHVAIFAQFLLV